MIHSTIFFTMIMIGVATGQIRQKTFKVVKITDSPLCILDNPFRSLFVGKLQCTFECTALTGCDYFNVIEQGGVNNGGTKTCQLFKKKPSLIGKLLGCTAFEVTVPNYQSIASLINIPATTSVTIVPTVSIASRIMLQNKVAYGTGTVSFNVGWSAYANGFGQPSLTDNYWIGNNNLYALTSGSTKYRLRFEILRTSGGWLYAEYDWFVISSSSASYQLNVYGTCSGNAGDALRTNANTGWTADGRSFSTTDCDSDGCPGWNCAQNGGGSGWWYGCCSASALNSGENGCWYTLNTDPVTCDVVASRMYAQQT